MTAQFQIPIGSVLTVTKGPVEHVGIVAWPGLVFHNNPTRGEHVSSIQDFSKGKPVTVVAEVEGLAMFGVQQRIRQMLQAPNPYSLGNNNCEHSLMKALGVAAKSPQLRRWGFVGLLGLSAFLILKGQHS